MNQDTIVAAIDAGHGHIKWAMRRADGAREFGTFSALAPMSGNEEAHKVIAVPVREKVFQIGPDSHMCIRGHDIRQRHDQYCTTDAYYALNLAALAYMRQPRINVLVVGLPLSTVDAYKATLVAKLTGRHMVPNLADPRGGLISVDVRQVVVLSQPAGALIGVLVKQPELRKARTLVADLGFYTLDALTSLGSQVNRETSTVVKGGQQKVLAKLHEIVAAEYKQNTGLLKPLAVPEFEYERLLANNEHLRTGAASYDLKPFWAKACANVFDEYLRELASQLDGALVEYVVLAGGGAADLKPYFERQFPDLKNVVVAERPQLAIVEGYLEAGLMQASRHV
jgi:plasmid segregation protein ParM